MIRSFFISAILLLLLGSCAGNLRVSLKGCEISQVQIADTSGKTQGKFEPDRSFTTKIWSFGMAEDSVTEVTLKDVLIEQGVSCVNIKTLRYTLGQSFWDQIFSVVPLIQRSSLKVEMVKTADAVGF